ncbi:MAG TPA: sensor histidine kinase [Syntrophorhabdaceae bacterium]|nr:sensor histidine kinase [Deltaproteobacteria bacterium]HNT43712.1 sensor histidine kinase [Syntrophorhabdaceae bacterium]HOD74759.1 sensor histidine kinase [Syntrophorhabdaceae bacterium]
MDSPGTAGKKTTRREAPSPSRRPDTQEVLEQRVQQRTAQLSELNALLRQEIAERRKMETALQDSRERLRHLSIHLQKIRENERTSLSRELHDEFGQTLTGMKLDVSWIKRRVASDDGLVVERLDSVLADLDRTIIAVQQMSARLRPVALDDFGLRDAVELAARDVTKRTNIACHIISEPYNITLNDTVTTGAFRILQEALTNVVRHSGAREVTILLRKRKDVFTMEISDDGKGIRKKELVNPRSIGLTGMHERAHALGGTLAIMGVRGKGTSITLTVPLRPVRRDNKRGMDKCSESSSQTTTP